MSAFSRRRGGTWLLSLAVIAGMLLTYAAVPSHAASTAAGSPVKIGFSVSLSGDFSSDGKAILQGYQLWTKDVNSHGGLMGRQVKLIYYNDNSSQSQVATNYTKLITSDKVDLTFGPFSSLLTIPAAQVARRYGYAFLGPAGGGPTVFQQGFTNYFFVQPSPVASNMVSFTKWVKAQPKSKRPTTAAYITLDDPFAKPEVDTAKSLLSKMGIKTVYNTVIPAEATDFQPIGVAAAHAKAQVVLIGSPGSDLSIALIHTFIQQHYSPKAIIATSGPDQGATFSKAIGVKNTEGIMVPEGWWPGSKTFYNKTFVSEYLKKYGGKVADISQDVPEAFSVGQIVQQVVKKTHSLNNATIIKALHSGKFQTVQGPMRWNKIGQPQGDTFIVQWQKGNTFPVYPKSVATKNLEYPKPNWH